ncbi:hypothetical protein ACFX5U_08720 [Sphingobacterium sp. SG20118]|uniref:hypothetical protein n=1 Tax=Sphingobacterium sp. SG20118 TaxID=3367156 RepID=UPI0037DFC342
MKQIFDNPGVAWVQDAFLALTGVEFQAGIDEIRNDFPAWLRKEFYFLPHQEQQLDEIPASFLERIASHIADSYENGEPVQFYKETPPTDPNPDFKQLVVQGMDEGSTLTENSNKPIGPFAIFIRYVPIP